MRAQKRQVALKPEMEKFLEYLKAQREYGERALKNHRAMLLEICDFMEERNITYIDANVRNLFITTKELQGVKQVGIYRTIFNHFEHFQKGESIPIREILKIPMKKAPKKHRPSFSMEEVSLMFSLPDLKQHFGFRDQVLLCTLYASGTRAQEICDLKVRSLDNSEIGTSLIITGKGEKTRRIRISDKCATLLKEFIKRRKIADKPDAHIFSSLIHEKMTISCVEEIVKKYVRLGKEKRPDLFLEEGYTAHSWRHTIAVHMIEAGLSIVVIKNFLGHSSIVTTQIYAELTQASVDKKIKEWNEKWFSPDVKQKVTMNKNFFLTS